MTTFPPAQPHGPPVELFPNVFVFHSQVRMGPLVSLRRNMIVLRDGEDLTLVNAVRLTPEGEAALESLGKVRHLVKLGHFHTLDDPYTRDRFSPIFWAPRPPDERTEKLVSGGASPVGAAEVFVFDSASVGEAALVLRQPAGGLLITCDSVQHWADTAGCSFLGGVIARSMGFYRRAATIGPIWAKQATGGAPAKLRGDFDRLLSADFAHLVSGHGALLKDVAKTELTASAEALR